MRREIFLVGLVLVFGVLVFGAETGNWFEVSESEGVWEIGDAGDYTISPDKTFRIKDSKGNLTSEIGGFDSGKVNVDEAGVVKTFNGKVGKYIAVLILNGKGISVPEGAQIDYVNGRITVTPGEDGGKFSYKSKGLDGEFGSAVEIDSNGKPFYINEGLDGAVISSKYPLEITGIESGVLNVEPIGSQDAIIGIGRNGEVNSFKNAEVGFEEGGFIASSVGKGKTDVSFGNNCAESNSYLCVDGGDRLRFGSDERGVSPDVVFSGENKFFEGNERGDYVKFSGADGATKFDITDRKVIFQNGEIINGDDKLVAGMDGEIHSLKVIGSEASAMPMDVYSYEGMGVTADYTAEVTEDGVVTVREAGWKDQYDYNTRRESIESYLKPTGGIVEEMPNEGIGSIVSEKEIFNGYLEADEEVVGYTVYNSKHYAGMSKGYREQGTIKQAQLYSMCGNIGVECLAGGDHTNTVMNLYDKAQDPSKSFYATFKTNTGKTYELGDISLKPKK